MSFGMRSRDSGKRKQQVIGDFGQVFTPHVHEKIHLGLDRRAEVVFTNVNTAQDVNVGFLTGNQIVHFSFTVATKKEAHLSLFGGVFVSSVGTTVPVINSNTNSPTTVKEFFFKNTDVTSFGDTLINSIYLLAGQKYGEVVRFGNEFQLQTDTQYLIRITGLENANFGNVEIQYYV